MNKYLKCFLKCLGAPFIALAFLASVPWGVAAMLLCVIPMLAGCMKEPNADYPLFFWGFSLCEWYRKL
jgi:hypothetical protein